MSNQRFFVKNSLNNYKKAAFTKPDTPCEQGFRYKGPQRYQLASGISTAHIAIFIDKCHSAASGE